MLTIVTIVCKHTLAYSQLKHDNNFSFHQENL